VAALIPALAIPGCGTDQEEAVAVDHRMGFLPDSLRRPPEASPGGYVLHPPAWARIHRDSLCLAVDGPEGAARLLILDVILRNPRTGDSLAYGQASFSTFFSNREVHCQPVRFLGGREAWQAPVEVELSLREFQGSDRLASRKLVVDPDFGQLDLQPFPVRFFPDRPGMEWLIEGSVEPGGTFREIRRLVSCDVLPEGSSGICPQDSVIRVRYYARDCAPGDPPAPDAELLRCSAALDSALAAGPLELEEESSCAWQQIVQLDSALLANQEDGYGAGILFGSFRATHHLQIRDAGYSVDARSAEGIGDYSFISDDSAAGRQFESRVLAVK